MSAQQTNTRQIQQWLDLLCAGNESARNQLLDHASERLYQLTRKMLRRYPSVRRWEQTDDVVQNAVIRLHRTLEKVQPVSVRNFFALATTVIRSELIDLARHYFGPQGQGAHHVTKGSDADSDTPHDRMGEHVDDSAEPSSLEEWTEFHERVAKLPEEEREVVSLLFYQGMTQTEAASLLGISDRTIKRRWLSARLLLRKTVASESTPVPND